MTQGNKSIVPIVASNPQLSGGHSPIDPHANVLTMTSLGSPIHATNPLVSGPIGSNQQFFLLQNMPSMPMTTRSQVAFYLGIQPTGPFDTTPFLLQFFSEFWHKISDATTILQDRLNTLESRLSELCDVAKCHPFTVSVITLAPSAFKLTRDIPVVVKKTDDENCIATFFDANLSASGDTEEEAVFNLKDLIVETIEILSAMPAEKLGVAPTRQLAVLRSITGNGA